MSISTSMNDKIKTTILELSGKNLAQIAQEYNISIHTTDLSKLSPGKEISGLIFYNEKKEYSIFLNEKDSSNRKRFTLAHELGHFFLHKDILDSESFIIDQKSTILFRMSENPNDTIEQEANAFAAELLMPEKLVVEARNKTNDIDDLATAFEVSPLAMSYRLTNIGLISD